MGKDTNVKLKGNVEERVMFIEGCIDNITIKQYCYCMFPIRIIYGSGYTRPERKTYAHSKSDRRQYYPIIC